MASFSSSSSSSLNNVGATISTRLGTLGRIGFGTYRLGNSSKSVQLLRRALVEDPKKRINLIDTSANYILGESEEAIGAMLKEARKGGRSIEPPEELRKRLCIVTKAGYIQGPTLDRYHKAASSSSSSFALRPPEAVQVTSECLHSIYPEFLQDQIERSLGRLSGGSASPYIDLFLLHNPEYFLIDKIGPSQDPKVIAEGREAMFLQIKAAFERLEHLVVAGKIRSYGISSNSFSLPADHPHFLPYSTLLDISLAARRAAFPSTSSSSPPSLAGLQMPANLLEKEGLEGCARWATNEGLVVLTNRPLNAYVQPGRGSGSDKEGEEHPKEYRLADYPVLEDQELSNVFGFAIDHITKKLEEAGSGPIQGSPTTTKPSSGNKDLIEAYKPFIQLLQDLYHQIDLFSGSTHFEMTLMKSIVPWLDINLKKIAAAGAKTQDIQMLTELFQLLLAIYSTEVKTRSSVKTRRMLTEKGLISSSFAGAGKNGSSSSSVILPSSSSSSSSSDRLQLHAMRYLLDNPNVSVALMGITSEEYLDDAWSLLDERASKK